MKKNILIALLLGIIAFQGWRLRQSERPNNQYELLVNQNGYLLKDGDRVVKYIGCDANPMLDSVILSDNQ